MNRRRQLLATLLSCCVMPARAQARAPYRVGYLSLGQVGSPSPFLDAFRQGMKARGYLDGQQVAIEARMADGSRERADQMVVELVQSKVDVIVTQAAAVWSAYRHAGTTPVVMGFSGDPVEAKLVDSLGRPGGTRTGVTFLAPEMIGKRLEVLAQVLPQRAHVAIVANPDHPGEQLERRHSQLAAQELGLRSSYFPVQSPDQMDAALKAIAGGGVQAMVVFPDVLTMDQREKIAAFGIQRRLPTVAGWDAYAESGFLMSYGPNLRSTYARLAAFVDRILKGTRPADLPVELPTTVEFIVNARTAQAMGITLPQVLLLRANSIIQ
jgi:putative ABC transport system substrate-binding protein